MEALTPRGRAPVRVQIDLNSRDRRGYVRTRLAHADGPVDVGDEVIAFEPDDQVSANARVIEVDRERGFLYLHVEWDSLDDDNPGGLTNADEWRATAPSEAVRLLAEWAKVRRLNLTLRRSLPSGYTSALLALADLVDESGSRQKVIVKVSAGDRLAEVSSAYGRVGLHTRPDFYASHFPRLTEVSEIPGSASVVEIGSVEDVTSDRLVPLAAFLDDERFTHYCEIVLSALIKEWNSKSASVASRTTTIGEFVDVAVANAESLETVADAAGLDPHRPYWKVSTGRLAAVEALPNPIFVLRNAALRSEPVEYLVGQAHGDLNINNILIPQDHTGHVRPEGFMLIDLSSFGEMPLSRDPMTLLLSAASAWLGRAPNDSVNAWSMAELVVDPNVDTWNPESRRYHETARAIHKMYEFWDVGHRLKDHSIRQNQLDLTAITLRRATRQDLDITERALYLKIATFALRALMSGFAGPHVW